jgi:hypothetical protein
MVIAMAYTTPHTENTEAETVVASILAETQIPSEDNCPNGPKPGITPHSFIDA